MCLVIIRLILMGKYGNIEIEKGVLFMSKITNIIGAAAAAYTAVTGSGNEAEQVEKLKDLQWKQSHQVIKEEDKTQEPNKK